MLIPLPRKLRNPNLRDTRKWRLTIEPGWIVSFRPEWSASEFTDRVNWNAPPSGDDIRPKSVTITDVRMEGRHLDDIHYWISEGAMRWAWEKPADFKLRGDITAIISRIAITTEAQLV